MSFTRISSTRFFALGFAILAGFALATAAEPPRTLKPLVTFVGADTHITSHECRRILDESEWVQFWLKHAGKPGRPQDYNQYQRSGAPAIDFEQCMVIAVTESPGVLNAGIAAVSIVEAERELTFDYDNLHYQAIEGSSAPGNAYGYFVLPRSAKPIVVRHNVQESTSRYRGAPPVWEEVVRFPAITAQVTTTREPATPVPKVASPAVPLSSNSVPLAVADVAGWNVVFAHDPGPGKYDGVVGRPHDAWNFVDAGTRQVGLLKAIDGRLTPVGLKLSETDGRWGIEGQAGIFHGYLYHNCRCVDVQATLTDLPAGHYRIYVYAHGDAPDQNADIELSIAGETLAKKPTLNDGTWKFRSREWTEGNQFVSFDLQHGGKHPVDIISHRAGSVYSMLNALQIVRIDD